MENDWSGWDGDTVVELSNGTVWKQDEYYYRYQYKYRPVVTMDGNRMQWRECPARFAFVS